VGFAIMLYIARRLGPDGFATFSLGFAWVHLCWAAVDLGTSNYALRLLTEEPANRTVRLAELFSLNLFLAALTAAVVGAGVWLLIRDDSLRLTTVAMLVFLLTFASFPDWYLRGTSALNTLSLANFAAAALWLLLTFTFGNLPQPAGFALAWALSPLAGAAIFWASISTRNLPLRRGINPASWLAHVKISGLFAVSGALSNATIPAVITGLRIIGGSEVLGAYAVGLRIAAVMAGALLIVLQNLTPHLIRQRASLNKGRFVVIALFVGFLAFGAISLLAPILLIPLVGSAYQQGLPAILLGFAAIIPWSAKFPIEALLISHHADRPRIAMQLVSLSVIAVAAFGAFATHTWLLLGLGYLVGEAAGAIFGWLALSARVRLLGD
jgi:O-antigen/teichoic acid export membrane protein